MGIGGLLWTASKGLGAITRAGNRALGAERTHHFLLSKSRYFLMAAAVSVLMIASIAITVALEIVLDPSFLSRLGLDGVELPRLQGWAANLVLVSLIFALIYKLAPHVEVRWRQVLPGAFLAVALFELVKSAFVVYLDRIADFEAVYGSLSSIIVLLLWLYLSAVILIYGAEYSIVRSQASEAAAETDPGGAE
ncbi:MAG: YihY/virulence factor BrkB family protein [Thermoanaerobaculia bacterium]